MQTCQGPPGAWVTAAGPAGCPAACPAVRPAAAAGPGPAGVEPAGAAVPELGLEQPAQEGVRCTLQGCTWTSCYTPHLMPSVPQGLDSRGGHVKGSRVTPKATRLPASSQKAQGSTQWLLMQQAQRVQYACMTGATGLGIEACWWVQRHRTQRPPTSRGSVDDRRHRLWGEGLLVVDPDGVDQVGAQVPRLNKLVGVHAADKQVQRLHTAAQRGGHRVSRRLQRCRALQAGQVSFHVLGPEEANSLSAADKGSWTAGSERSQIPGPGVGAPLRGSISDSNGASGWMQARQHWLSRG